MYACFHETNTVDYDKEKKIIILMKFVLESLDNRQFPLLLVHDDTFTVQQFIAIA